MHRLFKLQHHSHTGRVLAHHHTSYRALILVIFMAGVVMLGTLWGLKQAASADTIFVTATVPAPIPTDPSEILKPSDGTMVYDPVITVSGLCPVVLPAVSVAIYDNGVLKGSTPCQSDGTFSLQMTLLAGANSIVARTITMTGDYGPDSATINVTYVAPKAPETGSPGGTETTNTQSPTPTSEGTPPPAPVTSGSQPIYVDSNKAVLLFEDSNEITWTGFIGGGQTPYTVRVDWGDGDKDTYYNVTAGKQSFTHTYKYRQSYAIIITVEDRLGNQAVSTFAILSASTPPPAGSILATTPPDGTGISPQTLVGVYGGYISILALVTALWLHAHTTGAFAYATATTHPARRLGLRRHR